MQDRETNRVEMRRREKGLKLNTHCRGGTEGEAKRKNDVRIFRRK